MSIEENKAVVQRYFDEVWNGGENANEVIRELVQNDWLPSDPALSHMRPRSGTTGIDVFVRIYRSAFPDLKFTVEEMVAEGDIVVAHFEARGTNSGKEVTIEARRVGRFTIQPSGRTVEAHGLSIHHIVTSEKNGAVIRKIREISWYWRGPGLLEALAIDQLREREQPSE